MEHRATSKFWQHYHALPPQIRMVLPCAVCFEIPQSPTIPRDCAKTVTAIGEE
jgi:hypothetical protein